MYVCMQIILNNIICIFSAAVRFKKPLTVGCLVGLLKLNHRMNELCCFHYFCYSIVSTREMQTNSDSLSSTAIFKILPWIFSGIWSDPIVFLQCTSKTQLRWVFVVCGFFCCFEEKLGMRNGKWWWWWWRLSRFMLPYHFLEYRVYYKVHITLYQQHINSRAVGYDISAWLVGPLFNLLLPSSFVHRKLKPNFIASNPIWGFELLTKADCGAKYV